MLGLQCSGLGYRFFGGGVGLGFREGVRVKGLGLGFEGGGGDTCVRDVGMDPRLESPVRSEGGNLGWAMRQYSFAFSLPTFSTPTRLSNFLLNTIGLGMKPPEDFLRYVQHSRECWHAFRR